MNPLLEWLGDGGVAVPAEIAERRAGVCATCEKNVSPNWLQTANGAIADKIREHLEVKNKMGMRVSIEDKMHFCKACGCALKLKVWCPISHIKKGTSEATMGKFTPFCWIRTEAGPA